MKVDDKQRRREVNELYARFGPKFVMEDTEAILRDPRAYVVRWFSRTFGEIAGEYGDYFFDDTQRILERICRLPGKFDGKEFVDFLDDIGMEIIIYDADDSELPGEGEWEDEEDE